MGVGIDSRAAAVKANAVLILRQVPCRYRLVGGPHACFAARAKAVGVRADEPAGTILIFNYRNIDAIAGAPRMALPQTVDVLHTTLIRCRAPQPTSSHKAVALNRDVRAV
jgi:hypothetical protein